MLTYMKKQFAINNKLVINNYNQPYFLSLKLVIYSYLMRCLSCLFFRVHLEAENTIKPELSFKQILEESSYLRLTTALSSPCALYG